jgi:hypothetical protein
MQPLVATSVGVGETRTAAHDLDAACPRRGTRIADVCVQVPRRRLLANLDGVSFAGSSPVACGRRPAARPGNARRRSRPGCLVEEGELKVTGLDERRRPARRDRHPRRPRTRFRSPRRGNRPRDPAERDRAGHVDRRGRRAGGVDEGEVTLAGRLESHRDALLLPRLIAAVPGVVGVDSKLTWADLG